MPSWAHEHLWPKRPGCGYYRFCKHCQKDVEKQPTAEQIAQCVRDGGNPGRELDGCAQNNGSPSAMATHVKEQHSALAPQDVNGRKGQFTDATEKVDDDLMRDWSTNVSLDTLQALRLIDDPGVRVVFCKRIKGLGGRTRLRKEIESNVEDIREEVTEKLAQASADGCRFCISGDGCSPLLEHTLVFVQGQSQNPEEPGKNDSRNVAVGSF